MHWTRVKTILIMVFLVIDIVLVSSIIMTSYSAPTIEETLIEDTVSILGRNNIKADKSVIPRTIQKMGMVELRNAWTDDSKAAAVLTGGDMAKTVSFSENEFHFTDSDPAAVIFSKEGYKQAFEKMGIYANEENIKISGTTVTAKQSIGNGAIFETEVFAETAENGGIAKANGYWILFDAEGSISTKTASQLTPITSVLINFTENPYKNPDGEEITLIETGYSLGTIYRDTMHKLVSVIPAYKITTLSGNYYMYDAMTGDFLYANINNEILY